MKFWERVRAAFCPERLVSRAFAAWFSYSLFSVLGGVGDYWQLAFGQDRSLLQMLLQIGLLFLLFSIPALLSGDGLHTDSWLLMLSGWMCGCIWLLQYDHATNEFLNMLAVCAVMALITVFFVNANLPLLSRRRSDTVLERADIALGATLAAVAALASFAVIAAVGCCRYLTFSSPNYDFGLFVNMFHNMKETGLPLVTSERDRLLSHFAVHLSPIYYLLLPFYCIFPSPLTLQIGQAAVLILGVIPVALLCRHFRLSGRVTALVCVLYCFYPALSCGTFYDIHENCFLTLTLLLTFLFYEKKKYIPMYLSALAVLAVKEDAAIYLLVFAMFVLLCERRPLHGILLSTMSVGYFALALYLLNAHGTGTLNDRFYNLMYNPNDGLLGALKTALGNAGYLLTQLFTTSKGGWEKVVFFLQMLLPLGFLPFCTTRAGRWLLISPILISMVSYYQYLYDINFQYQFATVAFLFYATVKNLPELAPVTRRNLLSLAAAACCCVYLVTVVPKFSTYTNRYLSGGEQYTQMEEFLNTLPEDASVACSSFLLAHLADRGEIYELYYHKNEPDVDYVVIDLRYSDQLKYRDAYRAQGYQTHSELDNRILVLQKGS